MYEENIFMEQFGVREGMIEQRETDTIPEVSVIMGIHNMPSREITERAICSILEQSLFNIEFIICDDASDEETKLLLKYYYNRDNRIILLENSKQCGLAYSLNSCIKEARAQFIARMDADDISKKERLALQLHFLKENDKYAMVGSSAELISGKQVWGVRNMPEIPKCKDFLWNSPFIHPSIMVRSNVFKEINGYYVSKETRRMEDYDLFMRMYEKGFLGYNIQTPLLIYREDKESMHKRKYKYRLDEAKVRWKNFNRLGLMPEGIPYVIKPLVVGLIPPNLLQYIRKIIRNLV